MISTAHERPLCSLCLQKTDSRIVRHLHFEFCAECLKDIGVFAGKSFSRSTVWTMSRTTRSEQRMAAAESEAVETKSEKSGLFGPLTADEVFSDFTEGLADIATPDDAQVHADLGLADQEMGMGFDALDAAAFALQHVPNLPDAGVRTALSILLNPLWLGSEVDVAIAALRVELSSEIQGRARTPPDPFRN